MNWRDKFEQARNSAGKKMLSNTKVGEEIEKGKEVVDTAKKTVQITKKVSSGLLKVFSGIINVLLFLITNPVGWLIDVVIVLMFGVLILGDTVGQNSFNSTCPIDPITGKPHTESDTGGSETDSGGDKKKKSSKKVRDCKVYGDGTGKGRTSGGGAGSNNAGGTGEWAQNGTGSVNVSGWAAWKPNDLPDDVKKYALNPESVGMSYGSSEGWNAIAYSGAECTDLSASLMYAIWEKDGEHPHQTAGNGRYVAGNWAARFGGSVTNEPTAGAVFSSNGLEPAYGHTGVVSHVFENGDFLTVEQNMPGLSGRLAGMVYTWNYVYHSKSEIVSDNYEFFDPSTVGFKLVSAAVSH